ncbi:M56 family metallopeptidase [Streptomyces sp. DSM 44915]|uniref:M56 family metallopeptidase n=1 Tax=Streptomyces chisholmiae TaxID=3075540 RepID=A0ABU2JLU6_9ACTN|nr:M56 family metallopeptidase [Streptomyces sp. DSM 44915]MDT0265952.1 M56 family metallopeptidase [Streptomyces sp. DSM 44915]
MVITITLLGLGALTAAIAPRVVARGAWSDREPVLALWMWQCVVAAVLLCCVLAMAFSGAAAWRLVHGGVFAPAPAQVVDAYALPDGDRVAAGLALLLACGGLWTAVALTREVYRARVRRRRRRAELLARSPLLPGEVARSTGPLVVCEDERPDAWLLPGSPPQLMITTAALRRLNRRQLDAVLAHERGHARARHHWLQHCAGALAGGFPGVPVFAAFQTQVHRLVELSADDMASRRFGRLTTALALVGLNEGRGVFGCATEHTEVPQRVNRLLEPERRLSTARRLRLTAAVTLVPVVPLLVAFAPGLTALHG